MPIQEQNIVFVQSQVMDDVPEGGGAATGRVIVDGAMNNVFEDISDLDRAYGRFNLRKVFVAVRTLSADLFGGAKSVITDLPLDDALSYTIFSTKNPFDRRAEAAGRVEAYLVIGSELPGYLLENHVAGMRSIQIFQRPGAALPEPGKTLVLKSAAAEQYVRATRVTPETRTFTYSASGGFSEYEAAVVTVEISDALRHDFAGSPPSRAFVRTASATALRDVVVADAARYYGAVRLSAAAEIGDLGCRAESIYTRLVPSAQTEIPLVDKPLAGETLPMVAAAPGTLTANRTAAIAPNGRYVLPTGCWPGSLVLTIAGNALSDNGLGSVLRAGVVVGAINYATGEIAFNGSAPSASGATTETYRPAAGVGMQSYTLGRDVTEATRAYTWVLPLVPLPAPGSVVLSYMAQGKWYDLRDNGLGVLSGTESGFGTGTLSHVTGTLNVTLGALPDVGSKIMVAWGTQQEFLQLTDAALEVSAPAVEFDFGTALSPGSLAISWTSGGVERLAVDDGAGSITGDAEGRIVYGSGLGWMRPSMLPDGSSTYHAEFESGEAEVFGGTTAGGTSWSATLPNAPIAPGSVVATLQIAQKATGGEDGLAVATQNTVPATLVDDKAGGLLLDGVALPGSSINYTTGAIVIAINVETYQPVKQYARFAMDGGESINGAVLKLIGYINAGVTRTIAAGGVAVLYRSASADVAPTEATIAPVGLSFDLAPLIAGRVVPGSLSFRLGGLDYVDRGGLLYHSVAPATGAGTLAGSVDYAAGRVMLTAWASGAPAFALHSGLINPGTPGQSYVSGRTAARPLKSQSLYVSALALDGTAISASAQGDGTLSGAGVKGSIDTETGIYELSFGAYAPDPEHPGQQLWTPRLVDPATLRYNAVAYSYLPLDADVLGIDPVRLPSDGRVPIFRVGDVAQIMHTAETTGSPSLVGGRYELSCGRTRLSWAKVVDADGVPVVSGYTLDRAAGKLIWESMDALDGHALPLTVRHTVSDLRQITDAQITGALSFARPLTHDYPAGESIVASCLIHGDRRARVSLEFDQQTWGNVWSDTLIGSNAIATLNTIAHPIVVSNEGAETERWVLVFTSTTTAQLIGEHVGLVWSGSFAPGGADIAPINPRTLGEDGQGGVPYLTIPGASNGGGWAAGNCVRINTVGAIADFWIARAIQQSDEPAGDGADGCEIYCLGNIDRP